MSSENPRRPVERVEWEAFSAIKGGYASNELWIMWISMLITCSDWLSFGDNGVEFSPWIRIKLHGLENDGEIWRKDTFIKVNAHFDHFFKPNIGYPRTRARSGGRRFLHGRFSTGLPPVSRGFSSNPRSEYKVCPWNCGRDP